MPLVITHDCYNVEHGKMRDKTPCPIWKCYPCTSRGKEKRKGLLVHGNHVDMSTEHIEKLEVKSTLQSSLFQEGGRGYKSAV
jgi:hypothetical protein